jgi:hypothetical protein
MDLFTLGYLDSAGHPSGRFWSKDDGALVYAVREFQKDVGIVTDGVPGPITRDHLARAFTGVYGYQTPKSWEPVPYKPAVAPQPTVKPVQPLQQPAPFNPAAFQVASAGPDWGILALGGLAAFGVVFLLRRKSFSLT